MRLFCKNNAYKNKKILIYGLGISGIACRNFLLEKKAKVFTFQDGEKNKKINLDKIDFVVISPGVSLETPLSQEIKRRNIPMVSELELGFLNVSGKIIAITGTNGKTTSVSLLYSILKDDNTYLAGNIGLPLISLSNKTNSNSTIVCEVSSFQLESSELFAPEITAILNISSDHLARHKTFENYTKTKAKIYKNQTKNQICILNYDDENVFNLKQNCNAKIYFFSALDQTENSDFVGAYLYRDEIYFKENFENVFIMKTNKLKLIGKKNIENVLACGLIAHLLNISSKQIQQRANKFLPLQHRLELVLDSKKIRFINDSKATNVSSVIADLGAIEGKTVVLLGGSDKGEDFKPLFQNMPKSVVLAIVFGATGEKLKEAATISNFSKILMCKTLREAIVEGKRYCYENYVGEKLNLILSPACASYDEFKNFEERGDFFKNCINGGIL